MQAELDDAHELSQEYGQLQDELETLNQRQQELDAAHTAAEAARGAAVARTEELEAELGQARAADAAARAEAAAAADTLRAELDAASGDLQRTKTV